MEVMWVLCKFLLALASTVFPDSEFRGTHYNILLSRIWERDGHCPKTAMPLRIENREQEAGRYNVT
jgi:hypothetical protein